MKSKYKFGPTTYATGVLILLYLLAASFPWHLIIAQASVIELVQLLIGIFLLVGYFLYVRRHRLPMPQTTKLTKVSWYSLPLFLVCFSNIFYLLITGAPLARIDLMVLIQYLPLVLVYVVLEELIFRSSLVSETRKHLSAPWTIIITSIIFGVSHLININSSIDVIPTLIQVGYTTGLGLICCGFYIFTSNILLPIAMHFTFNIFNDQLYSLLATSPPDWRYYLINASIALVLAIYAILVYLLVLRPKYLTSITLPSQDGDINRYN